jgi:hypothetical protein
MKNSKPVENFGSDIMNKRLDVMRIVSKSFKLNFKCDNCKDNTYNVFIQKIHPKYFLYATELYIAYELFFRDLADFAMIKNRKVDIINFLQDSVENNYTLSDSLTKQNFTVKDDHIYTYINNYEMDLINFGEFIIDNFKVHTSLSYMFFTNLRTNEQYVYYGD